MYVVCIFPSLLTTPPHHPSSPSLLIIPPQVNQFLQLVKNVYCELPKTVVSPISVLVVPDQLQTTLPVFSLQALIL